MALGSITKAYQVYKEHDFSRSFQIRILNFGPAVPSYVSEEILEKPQGAGGYLYAKSYAIPGKTIQNIDVPYSGFQFKYPGQVAYDKPNPYPISFKTPQDYLVRNALERWMLATQDESIGVGTGLPCPESSMDIAVLMNDGRIGRAYKLIGMYPSGLSEIQYNQEENTITEFTADFAYQRWEIIHPYETGDDAGVSEQDAIYQAYESKILQGLGNCPTGLT